MSTVSPRLSRSWAVFLSGRLAISHSLSPFTIVVLFILALPSSDLAFLCTFLHMYISLCLRLLPLSLPLPFFSSAVHYLELALFRAPDHCQRTTDKAPRVTLSPCDRICSLRGPITPLLGKTLRPLVRLWTPTVLQHRRVRRNLAAADPEFRGRQCGRRGSIAPCEYVDTKSE